MKGRTGFYFSCKSVLSATASRILCVSFIGLKLLVNSHRGTGPHHNIQLELSQSFVRFCSSSQLAVSSSCVNSKSLSLPKATRSAPAFTFSCRSVISHGSAEVCQCFVHWFWNWLAATKTAVSPTHHIQLELGKPSSDSEQLFPTISSSSGVN